MKASRNRIVRVVVVLAVASVIASVQAPGPALAQGAAVAAPNDAAQAAYKRGKEHGKAGRWSEAVSAFEEAYRLRPAWDIAGNLGIAELELKRFVPAAKHLDESLRGFPGGGEPEQRAVVNAAFQEALPKVGRLAIRTTTTGATILVDGVAVGTDPLGRSVFVEPGKHVVEAKGADGGDRKEVEVAGGAESDVVLAPGQAAPGTSPAPTAPPPGGDSAEEPRAPVGAWILLGAGATVAVAGGVLLGVGLGTAGGAADDGRAIAADGGTCEPPSAGFEARCDDALSGTSTGNALGATGGVLLGVGAAAALGGVIWILTSGESSETGGLELRPVAGPDAAGLWIRGNY